MRDRFGSRIPDTAPYKEWLGIVGTMLAAVVICAFLFGGSVLI
jgi:CDP-diglyceride synthetase